nr:hypothetical protein [Pandoravirus massiliensis]
MPPLLAGAFFFRRALGGERGGVGRVWATVGTAAHSSGARGVPSVFCLGTTSARPFRAESARNQGGRATVGALWGLRRHRETQFLDALSHAKGGAPHARAYVPPGREPPKARAAGDLEKKDRSQKRKKGTWTNTAPMETHHHHTGSAGARADQTQTTRAASAAAPPRRPITQAWNFATSTVAALSDYRGTQQPHQSAAPSEGSAADRARQWWASNRHGIESNRGTAVYAYTRDYFDAAEADGRNRLAAAVMEGHHARCK